jgi:hypothetical protein
LFGDDATATAIANGDDGGAADDAASAEAERRSNAVDIMRAVEEESKLARARLVDGDDQRADDNSDSDAAAIKTRPLDQKHALVSSDDEATLVPVVHPNFRDTELRLGPKKLKLDGWCYICDVVNLTDAEQRPPVVMALLVKLAEYNYRMHDKVNVAILIKGQYDVTVRKNCGLPEWTLRGIYTHITEHDNSSSYLIEDSIDTWHRAKRNIEMRMYRAPQALARTGAYREEDLHIDKTDFKDLGVVHAREMQAITLREKLRPFDAASGESARIGGSSAARQTKGKARVTTMGGGVPPPPSVFGVSAAEKTMQCAAKMPFQ